MSAKRPKTGGRNRRKCRVRTAFLPQLREKKEKIRPKIKKHCQKQAKGDMINKNSKRKRVGFAIAIYPREGTETIISCRHLAVNEIAIYPREGTETPGRDENGWTKQLQFIPARGRKPFRASSFVVGTPIAIYPREGTETPSALILAAAQVLQFIPARGRKL